MQRKGKKGDGCTGEKTIHVEIYIFSHDFFVVVFAWGGGGGGHFFSDLDFFSFSLSLSL